MLTNSCNFGAPGGKGAQGTTSAYYGVSGSGIGDVKRTASTEPSDAPQQSNAVQGNGINIVVNVGGQKQ
ncbi:hypothetical protein AAVH_03329 [Aphelenchoides avenae]|nr:hypothetical protein AAVH_03329 [Aphelenchus avenae]